MHIWIPIKNVAKLLLIGGVLFSVSLIATPVLTREDSGKRSAGGVCKDGALNAYVEAAKQTRLESPDLLLVGDSCVKASTPPMAMTTKVLGSLVGGDEYYQENLKMEESKRAILEYVVEQNDTMAGIAEKFGINLDSVLWANNLAKASSIKPGQKLIIPPVTGVIHEVSNGETVSRLAEKYKVKTSDIVAFNDLSGEADIFIGDVLIIPGGKMPAKIAQQNGGSTALKPNGGINPGLTLPGNYFLCPISLPCRRTQGAHWRSAVDLSHGKCGDPIYAAASGIVQRVKYGWNKGAGNYVEILHPSGAITHYFHLQTIFVASGQAVSKGQNIALMGTTGLSTGCHLHFEIIGAVNPF